MGGLPLKVVPPEDQFERLFIRDLMRCVGKRVTVRGWTAGTQRTKWLRFLKVRDRTGTIQALCKDETLAGTIDGIADGTAVRLTGTLQHRATDSSNGVELVIERIDVLAEARTPSFSGMSRSHDSSDHRYADQRRPERFLISEVQTTIEAAMRQYLLKRGFVEIHTPKITSGGSESGAAVFELPYFGQRAYLAQSPQVYMQMAMAVGLDRAFEVGPVFRAEAAETNRHATEFSSFDVEMSWIDSHADLMDFEEGLLLQALSTVRDNHGPDIERHFHVPIDLPNSPIPRITVADARRLVDGGAESNRRLTYAAEQAICKSAKHSYGHSFVFLTDYPVEDRPFYTMRLDPPPHLGGLPLTRSFDLLWRGLEITSGCQREHRADVVQAQVQALDAGEFSDYLDRHYVDMFRHGCPPHGGFGIGLNRLLMALLGRESIRETTLVHRGPGSLVP